MLHTRTYLPGFRSIVVLLVLPGLVSLSSPTLASSLTSWLAPTFSWAAGVSVFSTTPTCGRRRHRHPATGTLGAAGGARGTLGTRAPCQRHHDQTSHHQRGELVAPFHRIGLPSGLVSTRSRGARPKTCTTSAESENARAV